MGTLVKILPYKNHTCRMMFGERWVLFEDGMIVTLHAVKDDKRYFEILLRKQWWLQLWNLRSFEQNWTHCSKLDVPVTRGPFTLCVLPRNDPYSHKLRYKLIKIRCYSKKHHSFNYTTLFLHFLFLFLLFLNEISETTITDLWIFTPRNSACVKSAFS